MLGRLVPGVYGSSLDGPPVEGDGAERHPEVDGPGEEGEGVAGGRGHVEVHRLLAVAVPPRAELLTWGEGEEGGLGEEGGSAALPSLV